jgi:hypothetical protein
MHHGTILHVNTDCECNMKAEINKREWHSFQQYLTSHHSAVQPVQRTKRLHWWSIPIKTNNRPLYIEIPAQPIK